LAGHDRLDTDRLEVVARELLRREPGDGGRELDDERLRDAARLEQLESPLERRQELDAVADHLAGVRVEREHRRAQPGLVERGQHGLMADVDPVERSDRSCAGQPFELRRRADDPHAPSGRGSSRPERPTPASPSASTAARTPSGTCATASAGSRASASEGGISRSGSASSTSNGPTAVRRSVAQCPPSAAAIERTYVPEPTWSASRTVPSVYATASSACTRERRSGISTAIPRRASR